MKVNHRTHRTCMYEISLQYYLFFKRCLAYYFLRSVKKVSSRDLHGHATAILKSLFIYTKQVLKRIYSIHQLLGRFKIHIPWFPGFILFVCFWFFACFLFVFLTSSICLCINKLWYLIILKQSITLIITNHSINVIN